MHILLEYTGHYADNFVTFIQKEGYSTFTYNPLLIKGFFKYLTLCKSKTDTRDALSIVRKLLSDSMDERYIVEPQMHEIKEMTRYQKHFINERLKNETLYIRVLDKVFPELSKIVKNFHNQFFYELLTSYPAPQKIKRLTADKVNQIQEYACLTIGNSSLTLQLEIAQLIEMIRIQTKQINKAQDQINNLTLRLDTDSPLSYLTKLNITV